MVAQAPCTRYIRRDPRCTKWNPVGGFLRLYYLGETRCRRVNAEVFEVLVPFHRRVTLGRPAQHEKADGPTRVETILSRHQTPSRRVYKNGNRKRHQTLSGSSAAIDKKTEYTGQDIRQDKHAIDCFLSSGDMFHLPCVMLQRPRR